MSSPLPSAVQKQSSTSFPEYGTSISAITERNAELDTEVGATVTLPSILSPFAMIMITSSSPSSITIVSLGVKDIEGKTISTRLTSSPLLDEEAVDGTGGAGVGVAVAVEVKVIVADIVAVVVIVGVTVGDVVIVGVIVGVVVMVVVIVGVVVTVGVMVGVVVMVGVMVGVVVMVGVMVGVVVTVAVGVVVIVAVAVGVAVMVVVMVGVVVIVAVAVGVGVNSIMLKFADPPGAPGQLEPIVTVKYLKESRSMSISKYSVSMGENGMFRISTSTSVLEVESTGKLASELTT